MLIVAGGWLVSPEVRAYPIIAMVTGIYRDPGGRVSPTSRDDRGNQEAATTAGKPIDYERDAHWLDPFVYGAVAYEVALLPQTADIAIAAAVVGMIVGVVAAGTSHFILSKAGNASGTIPAAAVAGAIFGAPTGLLFRTHAASLLLPPLARGRRGGAHVSRHCNHRSQARRFRAQAHERRDDHLPSAPHCRNLHLAGRPLLRKNGDVANPRAPSRARACCIPEGIDSALRVHQMDRCYHCRDHGRHPVVFPLAPCHRSDSLRHLLRDQDGRRGRSVSITALLAIPNRKLKGMQTRRAFWSALNILCGLTILVGAALMRTIVKAGY